MAKAARQVSDEELQLRKRARRRLVGAVVLALIVAVVLPMVLDSEPQQTEPNVEIHIPSAELTNPTPAAPAARTTESPAAGPAEPKSAAAAASVEPAPSSSPAAVADARPITGMPGSDIATPTARAPAGREPPADAAVAEAKARKAATKPAESREAESRAADAKDADAKAGARGAGAYVVQVAALADTAKARQLEKQVAGAGLKTYTEVVKTSAGSVTRVRAGPYASREAAEKARNQLKKAGLEGQVVPK